MSFWGSAQKSLGTGLQMGVRAAERADEEKWREKDYEFKSQAAEQAKETHTAEMEEHKWERLDREKKESFEKADRLIRMGRKRLLAGDEKGAASLWSEAYKHYPDGNEAMIILPQTQPEYLNQLIHSGQIDPKMAQSKVLIVSKKHGTIPMNSMKDLDMMLAEDFNQENYLNRVRDSEKRLAEKLNKARLNPIQMEDGTWMQESYALDPNGTVQLTGMVPHVGPIPMSEENKALRALGFDPHSMEGKEAKKVLYGLKGRQAGEPSDYARKMGGEELGLKKRASEREDTRLGYEGERLDLSKKADVREGRRLDMAEEARAEEIGLKKKADVRAESKEAREQEKHKLYMERGGKDTRTPLQRNFDRFKKNNPDYGGNIMTFNHAMKQGDPSQIALELAQKDIRVLSKQMSLSDAALEYRNAWKKMQGTNQGAGLSKEQFESPEEVKEAFEMGEISEDDALQILIDQFGMEP